MNPSKMYRNPLLRLETWDPIAGCSPVGEGCKNCWARKRVAMLANNPKIPARDRERYRIAHEEQRPVLFPERLDEPLRKKQPCLIPTCFMGDLFHEMVPFEFMEQIFNVTQKAKQHIYLILTKRPQRVIDFMIWSGNKAGFDADYHFFVTKDYFGEANLSWAKNLWLGGSASTQDELDEIMRYLLQIPAAVRWVSLEPMLEGINIEPHLQFPPFHENYKMTTGMTEWRGLDFVMLGGETGPGARPMEVEWARRVRDYCLAAKVKFNFKSWGKHIPEGQQGRYLLDGREWTQWPEVK